MALIIVATYVLNSDHKIAVRIIAIRNINS